MNRYLVTGLSLLFGLLVVGAFLLWPRNLTAPGRQAEVFRESPPISRIQEFYAAESRRIGAKDPNPALTRRRLESVAKELTAEEIEWLKNTALSPKEKADGRFFATYLLGLSRLPAGLAALREIALREIPKRNEKLERELRIQATEGIGHSCDLPSTEDSLLDIVELQLDEPVRDQAHRALYECTKAKPANQPT